MSVHRQPENTNKSHEAHPSLGKARKDTYRVVVRVKFDTGTEEQRLIVVKATDNADAMFEARKMVEKFDATYIRTVIVTKR